MKRGINVIHRINFNIWKRDNRKKVLGIIDGPNSKKLLYFLKAKV